jgi:hypothetical protein
MDMFLDLAPTRSAEERRGVNDNFPNSFFQTQLFPGKEFRLLPRRSPVPARATQRNGQLRDPRHACYFMTKAGGMK